GRGPGPDGRPRGGGEGRPDPREREGGRGDVRPRGGAPRAPGGGRLGGHGPSPGPLDPRPLAPAAVGAVLRALARGAVRPDCAGRRPPRDGGALGDERMRRDPRGPAALPRAPP